MKNQLEKRKYVLGETLENVTDRLKADVYEVKKPVTYMFEKNGESWNAYYVDEWTPSFGMSCVDKVDGVIERLSRFMRSNTEKRIFVRIEGSCGIKGLYYYLEVC